MIVNNHSYVMKHSPMLYKIVLLMFFVTVGFGQKIVHMNVTYDLDGDQLLEFIALELDPNQDVFPTVVRYYEIDADGYQTLVWEFTPPITLNGEL